MRRIFMFGAALVAALLFSAPADAQTTRAVALGTNDTGSGVHYDTNTSTAYVSGWTTPVATDLPRVWAISSNDTVTTNTLGLLSGGTTAKASKFSAGGGYLAGVGDSTSYSSEAIRWTFGSWGTATGTGVPSGGSASVGFMASDSGHVIGTGTPAFVWSPMTTLPGVAGPYSSLTFAAGSNSNGTIVSGTAFNSSGVGSPAKWTYGTSWTLTLLPDPNGIDANAVSVSANGNYIAGEVTTTTGTQAALWEGTTLNIVPDDSGNGTALAGAYGMCVVNDKTIFGQGTFGTSVRAFLWTAQMGNSSKTLDDYYQEHNNNVPGPTNFVEIQQACHAGGSYHIIAKGSNGLWYYVEVPEDVACQCTPICQWLHWISKTFFGGNPPWWLQWYLTRYGCNGCC